MSSGPSEGPPPFYPLVRDPLRSLKSVHLSFVSQGTAPSILYYSTVRPTFLPCTPLFVFITSHSTPPTLFYLSFVETLLVLPVLRCLLSVPGLTPDPGSVVTPRLPHTPPKERVGVYTTSGGPCRGVLTESGGRESRRYRKQGESRHSRPLSVLLGVFRRFILFIHHVCFRRNPPYSKANEGSPRLGSFTEHRCLFYAVEDETHPRATESMGVSFGSDPQGYRPLNPGGSVGVPGRVGSRPVGPEEPLDPLGETPQPPRQNSTGERRRGPEGPHTTQGPVPTPPAADTSGNLGVLSHFPALSSPQTLPFQSTAVFVE